MTPVMRAVGGIVTVVLLLETPQCGGKQDRRPSMRNVPDSTRGVADHDDDDCGSAGRSIGLYVPKRNVQLVATWLPDTPMRVTWAFEDRNGRDSDTVSKFGGQFGRAKQLCPGGFASIKVEVAKGAPLPDLMHCFVRVDGKIAEERRVRAEQRDPGRCDAGAVV